LYYPLKSAGLLLMQPKILLAENINPFLAPTKTVDDVRWLRKFWKLTSLLFQPRLDSVRYALQPMATFADERCSNKNFGMCDPVVIPLFIE
jgi:hypothetical protein